MKHKSPRDVSEDIGLAEGGQTVVRWSNADHWLRLQTAYDLAQARKRQDQIKVERYKRQSAA
jgi:hypothetical protein